MRGRPTFWLVVLILATFGQSYVGRQHVVQSQRAGCERQKLRDRNAAIAWSVATAQRRLDGDIGTARAYDDAASTYWRFAVIDCGRVYPAASPRPF
jgi:hypothetical protein